MMGDRQPTAVNSLVDVGHDPIHFSGAAVLHLGQPFFGTNVPRELANDAHVRVNQRHRALRKGLLTSIEYFFRASQPTIIAVLRGPIYVSRRVFAPAPSPLPPPVLAAPPEVPEPRQFLQCVAHDEERPPVANRIARSCEEAPFLPLVRLSIPP